MSDHAVSAYVVRCASLVALDFAARRLEEQGDLRGAQIVRELREEWEGVRSSSAADVAGDGDHGVRVRPDMGTAGGSGSSGSLRGVSGESQ